GALMSEVPGSSVVGEELSPAAARTGAVVWIVDPLDGTTNFLHGYPQYAVSIGALVGAALGAGVVHDVARNLVYWAATGHGAWLDERRPHASWVTQPRHALVATGFPFKDLPAPRCCLVQFPRGLRGPRGILRAGSAAPTSALGVRLPDVQAGASHNRSVFTLVAPPDAAAEAAFRSMRVATERIDLTKHTGQHPRMGAPDVVPFVPVRDMTMDECVAL